MTIERRSYIPHATRPVGAYQELIWGEAFAHCHPRDFDTIRDVITFPDLDATIPARMRNHVAAVVARELWGLQWATIANRFRFSTGTSANSAARYVCAEQPNAVRVAYELVRRITLDRWLEERAMIIEELSLLMDAGKVTRKRASDGQWLWGAAA